jgi:hypothetical protein
MPNKRRSVADSQPHPSILPEIALRRLQKYFFQISEVRSKGYDSNDFLTWQSNVKIVLSSFYGGGSLVFREFDGIWFTPGGYYDGQPESDFVRGFDSGLEQAAGFLKSRIDELEESAGMSGSVPREASIVLGSASRKAFVVHGHEHGIKETVARFLAKLDVEPIILHEQPDRGRTLIEKFEGHASEVGYAVVVLTADDVAYSKGHPEEHELRARQNVILELGYFIGRLGRKHTFALVEKALRYHPTFMGWSTSNLMTTLGVSTSRES